MPMSATFLSKNERERESREEEEVFLFFVRTADGIGRGYRGSYRGMVNVLWSFTSI